MWRHQSRLQWVSKQENICNISTQFVMEFSEYLQWDRMAPFLHHPVNLHRGFSCPLTGGCVMDGCIMHRKTINSCQSVVTSVIVTSCCGRVTTNPPANWKHADLRPLNFGIQSVWRKATGREDWRQMDLTTLNRKRSPIPILTGPSVEQLRWSRPMRYHWAKHASVVYSWNH